jgi:uncharacterized membrane protein YgcG
MKQFIGGIITGGIAAILLAVPAGATADDFRFTSFEADYYLAKDNDGRSTLKTVEKLVAVFPTFNQNHGIERAIPRDYDHHPTSLRVESVRDTNGKNLTYELNNDNSGNVVLRIGDAGTYVHGIQTYVITYTQHDVTKYFADTNADEFYWDINGDFWEQPFEKVTARVHLADTVAPAFNKKMACYRGIAGSTDTCEIRTDGSVITATTSDLRSNENMTVAVGFAASTFRGYEPSLWDKLVGIWTVTLAISSLAGFISLFWLSYRYSRISNRTRELEPVPVEYIPPKGVSVLTASQVGDDTRAETTAQIIDLAVRHYIRIIQVQEKSLFKPAEYELEIVKTVAKLSTEEKDFITTIFGGSSVGTKLETKSLKNNYSLYSALRKNTQTLTKQIKGEYGLRERVDTQTKSFQRIATILLTIGLIMLSPLLIVAAIVAFGCGWALHPLTDKGLELRRYLAGLKKYIDVAEKDRLKMLQSPEGAEKTGVTIKGVNDAKLVRLYERVLPYAVLFGQEKEWNKQLAVMYENSGSTPDWYAGQGTFNTAVFTSAMNDFSGSMNSYGASSSSSSGGSSGGGSSGGGGGGGGGGW